MKKLIIYSLIPAILLQTAGCYTSNVIMKEDLPYFERNEELTIITFRDEEYSTFSWNIKEDTLQFFPRTSRTKNLSLNGLPTSGDSSLLPNGQKNLPLSEIREISCDKLDKTVTAFAVAFGIITVVGIFALIKKSQDYKFPEKFKLKL